MRKRGDVSVAFVIGLVIAIVSFIPVLYLLVNFYGGENYGLDDVCEFSILTRGTAPSSVQNYVPLKCTTEKVCLTSGLFGGGCEKQFAGEKDVKKIRLPGREQEAKKKIEEVTARLMYDCWRVTGQGKLDLFGNYETSLGFDSENSTCIVCSRIAVDEDVSKKFGEGFLDTIDVNTYMKKEKVPTTSKTYLEMFTDKEVQSYAKIKDDNPLKAVKEGQKIDLATGGGTELGDIKLSVANANEKNKEMAIVFMQIKSKSYGEVLDNMALVGGTVAGAAFMTPVFGTLVKGLVFNPVGGTIVAVGAVSAGGYGMYNTRQGQLAAAGYCGDFVKSEKHSDDKAREGCSLVQGINYNFKDVNALCHKIEGKP